jgi:hypothetical protein
MQTGQNQLFQAGKGVLLENAITPIQQYSYTLRAKMPPSSAMIIDAWIFCIQEKWMDSVLYQATAIFTRLATRLREAGMKVFGFGGKGKHPSLLFSACDKFIYIEILTAEPEVEEPETGKPAAAKPSSQQQPKPCTQTTYF